MTNGYSGTLNTFSIGGNSQLEFFENATLTFNEDHQEGAPVSRFGGNSQGVKKNGQIDVSLFSDSSTDIRVSHLGLSAAALGSVDLLAYGGVANLSLNIDYQHRMKPGAGELWAYPIVTDAIISATMEVGWDTSDAPALVHDFLGATYANMNKVLAFTVAGTEFEIPFRMRSLGIPVEKAGLKIYTLELADRSARSGVTVKPTGTTSILQKAFNAPKTALAFAFQPDSAATEAITGDMVFRSLRMDVRDGALVPIQYGFSTQGAVTGADVA